ncbi:MAG: hypothetical protein OEM38_10885 [Gammaproteobacteria bacterium]|nr:hypothetical protein [Gammaproteobacteria bacterium]
MFDRNPLNRPINVLAITLLTLTLVNCTETLPTKTKEGLVFEQAELLSANIIRGGRLYDKWWEEKRIPTPSGPNPIWQYTATPESTAKNEGGQWRCAECHGWDYKGLDGTYSAANTLHFSGVSGLNNTSPEFTAESVFNFISNGVVRIKNGATDHDLKSSTPDAAHAFYGTGKLDAKDIYDLTKFIMDFANRDLIDSITGSPTLGKIVYTQKFSSKSCGDLGCHTNDSSVTKTDIIDAALINEAEFLHKVRLGSPSSIMFGGLDNGQAKDVLEFVKAGANTAIIPISNFDQSIYDALTNDNTAKGGLLYDSWWDESGASAPTTTHALWPSTNLTAGSTTWRCKECHGWDYRGKEGAYGKAGKHNTGIKGIVEYSGTTMQMTTANNVYSYLKKDTSHGFDETSTIATFSDTEYYALTKFIMTMRDEAKQNKASYNFINDTTLATVNGDAIAGKTLYTSTQCTTCHGANGKLLDFADHTSTPDAHEFLNNIALENPWKYIHKIRFGQPGPVSNMSGTIQIASTLTTDYSAIETAVDILAYSQTELTPNIKRAGRLYDKWWKVAGNKSAATPSTQNQDWSGSADPSIKDDDTWRCNECHGWDYNGAAGAYSNGTTHYTGIKGLIDAKALTETVLIDIIKNGPATTTNHAFGLYISDADITLLAKFILNDTEGIPPIASLAATLASTDNTNGKTLYEGASPGNCANCHGIDGKTLPNAVINIKANNNAQEFIHKARFGHPDSNMIPISTEFQGASLIQAGDIFAYGKTIGTPAGPADYASADPVRGGRLYDEWWVEMQSSNSTVLPPTQENPFWASNYDPTIIPLSRRTTDTWRCKSCHAWTYKGIGFFTNGTPTDSSADNLINKISLRRSELLDEIAVQNYIFNVIKSGDPSLTMHKFGGAITTALPSPMTDIEIWDLTKFLLDTKGMIDSSARITATGSVVTPISTNGEGLFLGSANTLVKCADSNCHGTDGTSLATDIFSMSAPFSTTNTTGDPWGALHKIRFGRPGTAMPSLTGSSLTTDDAYDILGYGQDRFNRR